MTSPSALACPPLRGSLLCACLRSLKRTDERNATLVKSEDGSRECAERDSLCLGCGERDSPEALNLGLSGVGAPPETKLNALEKAARVRFHCIT